MLYRCGPGTHSFHTNVDKDLHGFGHNKCVLGPDFKAHIAVHLPTESEASANDHLGP